MGPLFSPKVGFHQSWMEQFDIFVLEHICIAHCIRAHWPLTPLAPDPSGYLWRPAIGKQECGGVLLVQLHEVLHELSGHDGLHVLILVGPPVQV